MFVYGNYLVKVVFFRLPFSGVCLWSLRNKNPSAVEKGVRTARGPQDGNPHNIVLLVPKTKKNMKTKTSQFFWCSFGWFVLVVKDLQRICGLEGKDQTGLRGHTFVVPVNLSKGFVLLH